MKKILIASVLLAGVTSSAMAKTGSFGGFYGGILGGWGSIAPKEKGSKSLKGWSVGPQLGYGWMLAPAFYLGLDASFLFGGPSFKNKETQHKSSEKHAWDMTVQAGYVMGSLMTYGEVGIQSSKIDIKNPVEFSKTASVKATGISLGAGVKYKLGPVLASLGYRFSPFSYSGKATLVGGASEEIKQKAKSHKILLGLSYNF